jgi:hypothetical protein
MRSLGKIVLLLIFVNISLFAMVKASLKESSIVEGDEAVFMIKASGSSIKFPDIDEIEGYKIRGKSTNTNITYKNGKKHKSFVRKYIFNPQKDLTIPSYKVLIGGKEVMTKPLKLTVTKDMADANGTFIFTQNIDKTSAYVGEGILLTYMFKHKLNANLSDASFNSPKFDGFWAKKLKAPPEKTDIDSGYKIYTMKYLLYPQRSGTLHIDAARMDLGLVRSKKRSYYSFQSIKRKVIHSNELDIKVKDLPLGVELFGDFSFSVVADKNQTKANEAVNLTITINGEGNVDDIDDFTLNIPNATVYSDKPEKLMQLKDDKSIILFKQKFAIVSDRNFTIPSLSLNFLDAKSGEVKRLESKEKMIEVINAKSISSPTKLEKATDEVSQTDVITKVEISKIPMIISALFGFLLGALASWLYLKRDKNKEVKRLSIKDKIRSTKSDKELLTLLLPYLNRSSKISKIVSDLEQNIYSGKSHKIDKKSIASSFDELLKDDKVLEILKD